MLILTGEVSSLYLLLSFILLANLAFAQDDKPNLIVIYTDEHNFRTIGAYRELLRRDQAFMWGNGVEVKTPHLDSLAKEGALLTNFYVVAPLCTPSRASFMTGLYPIATGASGNNDPLDSDMTTFAEILKKKRGYMTGYMGKWHLNGSTKPGFSHPTRKFGFTDTKYQFNRGHWKFLEDTGKEVKAYDWTDASYNKFKNTLDENFTTDFLFKRGIEFIKREKDTDKPFALMLSIPDPHGPHDVREPYKSMYKNFRFDIPYSGTAALTKSPALPSWSAINFELEESNELLRSLKDNEGIYRDYFAMVKCIDDNVGKLMNVLKNNGLDRNTIVVFTSDHGDLMGEHAKTNKGRPYQTSAGVPFIIRYPREIPAGKVIKTAYSSIDFVPTILGLMNVDDPGVEFHGIDGSSELRQSSNDSNDSQIRFITDNPKNKKWAAAVKNRYKLVVSKGDYPWLFDLERDPNEIYNYFDQSNYTSVAKEMQDALYHEILDQDFPIKAYKEMFWDKPACWDLKDELPYWRKRVCRNLRERNYEAGCQYRSISKFCPVVCKKCCEDSPGVMWLDKELKSCNELTNSCWREKVQRFCPSTCDAC